MATVVAIVSGAEAAPVFNALGLTWVMVPAGVVAAKLIANAPPVIATPLMVGLMLMDAPAPVPALS